MEGRIALVAQPQRDDEPDREPVLELRSAEGAAQPGDTVALTVMRTARVKVSTADGSVAISHCLTAANLAALTAAGLWIRIHPTTGQVARRVGVSRQTIVSWVRQRYLPDARVGARMLVLVSAVYQLRRTRRLNPCVGSLVPASKLTAWPVPG